jgi:hypothetical protein
MSASWELQTAIYRLLTGQSALADLLGGPHIFDQPPQNGPYPYVSLGESVARDWSTGTDAGEEHILTLHVWSRAAGTQEVQRIMGALRQALNDQALSLNGYKLINLRHEFSDARRDPEHDLHHGIARFRAVTEQSA